jgi:hypothetical protein
LKKISKMAQLQAAFYRSLKLFVIGMATQAGTDFPTYDLKHLRIMGILQRVALCYLVVAVSEIMLPKISLRKDKTAASLDMDAREPGTHMGMQVIISVVQTCVCIPVYALLFVYTSMRSEGIKYYIITFTRAFLCSCIHFLNTGNGL